MCVAVPVEGLAWDGGSGVSSDGGSSWQRAKLDADLGRYSWRRFHASWTPSQPGAATIVARATSAAGESQGNAPRWNRAGYMKNDCMRVDVRVG